MNNTLTKIAVDLGELYHQRAELRIRDRKLGELHEKRTATLTPAEGWPGKNETERKCSMNTTLAADEELSSYNQQMGDTSDELERISASIHTLEEEKQAIQWTIRDGFLIESVFTEMADRAVDEGIDKISL